MLMEVGVSGEHWPSGGVNAALQILSSFNKDHHLAIDIGAHEGETAAIIHAAGLSQMRCISIEPNPVSFTKLKLNTQSLNNNNFEIEYLGSAVGSEVGTKSFLITDQSAVSGLLEPFSGVSERVPTGDHRIVERFDVGVITIDSLCASLDLDHIDLLKIDTEGFDLEVLRGARKVLERNSASVILSEVFFVNYRKDQCFFWDTASYLHQLGYFFVGLFDTRLTTQGRLYTGNGIWVSSQVGQSLGYL